MRNAHVNLGKYINCVIHISSKKFQLVQITAGNQGG